MILIPMRKLLSAMSSYPSNSSYEVMINRNGSSKLTVKSKS